MASTEHQPLATQADLRCHYDDMQSLLREFKLELLAEQKLQLEQSLDSMMRNVFRSGNDAISPPFRPAPTKASTVSHASNRSNERWTFAQGSQDIYDDKEQQPAFSNEANDKDEERSTPVRFSDSPARFVADKIQQQAHVEARGSTEKQPQLGQRSLSSDSQTLWIERACVKSIKSPAFDVSCGLIICFNAILVAVETECLAQEGDVPASIDALQLALNSWYMAELLLRLYAHRREFFFGDDRNWNMFDTLLVLSAIADLALSNINIRNLKTARILRSVRLFRIVRTLRIIRTFKYVREFRKMCFSLMSSVQTLFWSLLLVFGVMYVFALWFTQAAYYYKDEQATTSDARTQGKLNALNLYYSSFSRTIYTLFAAVSGGYSWHVLLDPWVSADTWMSCIMFFAFISIAVFGLMNIVTSVFVESAMHATRHFQDLLVDAQKKEREMYLYHMQRIFREIDKDGGGTISFKEMRMFVSDATSELPQYLEALGISSADVWVLFRLLDKDGSGNIDIGEFCEGCMRLKGEAKSFDINCMIYESRAMMRNHANFMEFAEEKFEQIGLQLEQKTLELGKRFSTGNVAIMSRLDKIDMRSMYGVSGRIAEPSYFTPRSEPHTPPTERSGAWSPRHSPAGGLELFGEGSRNGVSHRMRFIYTTPRQAATNQPKSFAGGLPVDEK